MSKCADTQARPLQGRRADRVGACIFRRLTGLVGAFAAAAFAVLWPASASADEPSVAPLRGYPFPAVAMGRTKGINPHGMFPKRLEQDPRATNSNVDLSAIKLRVSRDSVMLRALFSFN